MTIRPVVTPEWWERGEVGGISCCVLPTGHILAQKHLSGYRLRFTVITLPEQPFIVIDPDHFMSWGASEMEQRMNKAITEWLIEKGAIEDSELDPYEYFLERITA